VSEDSIDYPAMARALILGQHIAVGEMTRQALAEVIDPKAIIFKGLIPGMDVVSCCRRGPCMRGWTS
jgi:methanogenic corrinoid protein MtbC1